MATYPFDAASWQRGPFLYGGTAFFVDNSVASTTRGDDPSNGSRTRPFSTIDYAIGRCTASKGDVIFVMPGHAETVTAAITLDVAGVSIIGLGRGRNRPSHTPRGAIDAIVVSAANCWIENLRILGATSCTAHLNIRAADLTVVNCYFQHTAAPTESVTIASGADRFTFDQCRWKGTADGPDSCFFFEIGSSSISEWYVSNCTFNYCPNGLDRAVFVATADAAPGGIIKNCTAIGIDLEARFVDFLSSAGVGEGLIVFSEAQIRVSGTITDLYDLGGYGTARVAF